jgi:hypothetical protein
MSKSNAPAEHEDLVTVARGAIRKLKFDWPKFGSGPKFLNIREWHKADDGQRQPSAKRGLGIHVKELPGLFKAVILAAEKALAEGAGDRNPELLRELQAIVQNVLERLDTKPQVDTVRDDGVDTGKTLNLEGWTIRADKRGFYRGYRKIRGVQKSVYIGRRLEGAEEKVLAANERWP